MRLPRISDRAHIIILYVLVVCLLAMSTSRYCILGSTVQRLAAFQAQSKQFREGIQIDHHAILERLEKLEKHSGLPSPAYHPAVPHPGHDSR